MNKAKFFDYIRSKDFSITKDSVSGFDLILDEAVRRKTALHSLAYILATTYWETGKSMLPVREGYWIKNGEAWRKKNLRYYPYYGRGYVQLTWDYNYKKAGDKLGADFVKNPDLVMEPRYAVKILFDGMEEGWFTGKKLNDYIDNIDESDVEDKKEFEAARRIINGVDKKSVIADLAIHFEAALKAAGYGEQVKFKQSRTIKTAAFGLVGGLADPAKELANNIEPLIQYSDYIKYLFIAASLVGIGAMLYSRWKTDNDSTS